MVPSTLFPVFKYVYSEQDAITAFISPCQGPCPKAAIAVKSNIKGTLPMYPATTTSKRPAVATM